MTFSPTTGVILSSSVCTPYSSFFVSLTHLCQMQRVTTPISSLTRTEMCTTLGAETITRLIRSMVYSSPPSFSCSSLLLWWRTGIYQNKIDLATGSSLTKAELIFNGTLPLNSSSRPEGPHVYLINSTYYLLIAEGSSPSPFFATLTLKAAHRWNGSRT